MLVSDKGNGPEGQKAWRMRLHSEKMERAFAILIAIEGVEVSS